MSGLGRLARVLGLAAAIFVTGRLGLLLAVPPGYATIVWLPSGIALAALLLLGPWAWPGVLLGYLLTNTAAFWSPGGPEVIGRAFGLSSAISVGSTVQAMLGAYLIRRFVGVDTRLESGKQVAAALLVGGPITCLLGATIGVLALSFSGALPGPATAFSWWTWWIGDALGVVTFAPLLLLAFSPLQPRHPARLRAVGIPMVLASAATVALYLLASSWENHRLQLEFDRMASRAAEAFEFELGRNLEVLYSVDRFYASAQDIQPREFHDFLAPVFPNRPGLLAVSWAPWIPAASRGAFEFAMRRRGFPDFAITERGAGAASHPAGMRDYYVPILYLEPVANQQLLLGFDIASDSARRRALERARDAGRPTATGPIRLIGQPQDPVGIVVFQPVFHNRMPHQTEADRRKNLAGYINGVVQVGRLLGTASQYIDTVGMRLAVYDETDPRDPVLIRVHRGDSLHHQGSAGPSPSSLRWARPIEVADRRWVLRVETTPEYALIHRSWTAWVVLAGGLLFAAFLQGFLLILTGSAQRTENLVKSRTAELREANQVLSEEIAFRKEAELQAMEAVRVKSEFLNTMSHELRTPLNSVLGFTNVLLENRDGHLRAQELTWLERVQANGRHLLGLINSVLDLSRVEAGRATLELSQVALPALIDEVIASISPMVPGRPVALSAEMPPSPQHLTADLPKLRQILLNLTSNAVKFTESGCITIRVEADAAGRPLSLSVQDSGIGIPSHRLQAIFEAFEQGDTTIRPRYGGSGLGLSISRSLAELMGFRLSVRSAAGVGSTFVLHFAAV